MVRYLKKDNSLSKQPKSTKIRKKTTGTKPFMEKPRRKLNRRLNSPNKQIKGKVISRQGAYNKAYDQGFDEAYNEGFNAGYQKGMEHGNQEV